VIYCQSHFFSIEVGNVFLFKLYYALLFDRSIFNIQLLSLTAKGTKYLNRCNSCNYIYVRCIVYKTNDDRFEMFLKHLLSFYRTIGIKCGNNNVNNVSNTIILYK